MRKFGKSFGRVLLFAALSAVAAAFVFAFAACSDGGADGAPGSDPTGAGGTQTAVYAFYAADGSEILSGSAEKGAEISFPVPETVRENDKCYILSPRGGNETETPLSSPPPEAHRA